ncbi:unnamed protein product [Paramecium sonneborni]|uniref:EGF-like domain-containing protein n=1 Tax=Paramecium sonneborni TaxID=65129 RepID=A0A8S1RIJ1_9CILI|nr:unnamed protein product [Paramecium sonneborni]
MIILLQVLFLSFPSTNNQLIASYLTQVKNFTDKDSDGFISIDVGNSAIYPLYIDCVDEGSYIIINNTQSEVQYFETKNYSGYQFYYVTYDLIFFKTWNDNDQVSYTIGSDTNNFNYQNPQSFRSINNFCIDKQAVINTINFTISKTTLQGVHKFKVVATNEGNVAIKNLTITGLKCYQTCKTCSGSLFNECTECFVGTLSNQGTCWKQCNNTINEPYLVNNQCRARCPLDQSLYLNGLCTSYPITNYIYIEIRQYPTTSQYRWQLVNDFENIQSLQNILFENYYIYGIFKNKQGYQRVINLKGNYGSYLIGIKLDIILFNQMPSGSRISLLINETHKAHIYHDGNQLKFDQFISQHHGLRQNLTYQNIDYNKNNYYSLYLYVNASSYFIIRLIGDYLTSEAGWAIRIIQITSGQCPQYCWKCDFQFKCSKCYDGYFISRFGTCRQTCQAIYQYQINQTHCLDFDNETQYSQYLSKEFIDLSLNLDTQKQYKMLEEVGNNFIKGEGIYYSIWKQNYRIFGGPYIWAQAKFERTYNIPNPHHSISISFIMIFGPQFPDDGNFTLTIDNQTQFEGMVVGGEIEYQQFYKHSLDTLIIQWECKSTEPINAYCGFYQYYLAVHYCKPGCSQCNDQNDCLSTITICEENQYLELFNSECRNCLPQCKRCTSLQNCLECKDGFIDPSLGCICGINQYQNNDYQCQLCPQSCNQCINDQICLECSKEHFKILKNNKCECQEGYYTDANNICITCQQNCKICTNQQCNECIEGFQIQNANDGCQLNAQEYYSTQLYKSIKCPMESIDSINSCNPCTNQSCSCRDNIINGYEQCDDGNEIQYDGCHECQFQCQLECTKCIQGKCFECATSGWYLDLNNQVQICKEQCYDGLKVGTEECDDGIYIYSGNCKGCKFFCRPDCQQCDYTKGECVQCRQGLIKYQNYCINNCGDGILVNAPDIAFNEQCDDGNLIEFDGCSKNCQFQCQKNNICEFCQDNKCKLCQYGYHLNMMNNRCECGQSCLVCDLSEGQGCIHCTIGYELRDKMCYPICGDSIITYHEQCDDGNMDIEDGCHQCQFICEFTCQQCFFGYCMICEDGYEIQFGRCIYTFSISQIEQIEHQYLQVQSFQYLLEYFNQFEDLKYYFEDVPFIESLYILQLIEIDDSNIIINQPEVVQQSFCSINCLSCLQGLCFTCQFGYYLDFIQNQCNPICGDQFLTVEELYDDGNNIVQDGCFQCKFQCQDQCDNCYYGQCKSCIQSYFFDINQRRCLERLICKEQDGYYYDDKFNKCYSKCGDNIKAGKELCDDGNDTPFDGCYQCQFQCELLCKTCLQGICQNCQLGYKLQNSICVNDCGDGLIVPNESCDDANTIPRDGCTNCIIDPGFNCITLKNKNFCFICSSNCISCDYINSKIICLKCKKGYFLTSNSCIQCSNYCEECVDNPNNCTQCKIENCQKCDNKEGYYSDFTIKKCITKCGDHITAGNEQCDDGNIINNDGCNSLCEIEKGFQCSNNLCQKIPRKSIEFDYQNSTLNPFEINSTLSLFNYGCEIQFQFFKTITEINLIHLTIPFNYTDQQRILEEYQITIIPRKQIYYSSDQKQQALAVVSTSNQLTLLLQYTGPLTMLLGGITFFWTILEILTWINNFYFFNIDYPINVKMFFQKFKWENIIFIPEFFSLNQPNDPYYFQAVTKFQEKNVNPLFINNIQIFIGLICIATLTYFLTLAIIWIYKKKLNSNQLKSHKIYIFTKCHNQVENQQATYINDKNQSLIKKLQELSFVSFFIFKAALDYQYNFWSKILSIINLFLLDVFMACILQLVCPKNNYHYQILINDILAISFLVFILIIYNIHVYVSSKHYLLLNHSLFKKKYLSIYETINYENITARKYCCFNLIRKFTFILFIVLLYDKPILQTTFCCLSCFLNFAFLLYQNPFKSKSTLIQIGLPDFCIFCIVLFAILIAVDDMIKILDFQQKQLVGWLIISLISMSIAVQFLFLLIEFINRLKAYFSSLKNICFHKNKS